MPEAKYNFSSDKQLNHKRISCLLCLLCLVLIAVVIVLAVVYTKTESDTNSRPSKEKHANKIELREPEYPSVFHDLTKRELKSILDFLYKNETLNLMRPPIVNMMSNYHYLTEVFIPGKDAILDHLDNGKQQPPREAKVVIFLGNETQPVVKEFIVGPLPEPTYLRAVPGKPESIPFIFRPVNAPEYDAYLAYVTDKIHEGLGDLIESVYNGRLKNCGNECLKFEYFSQMSSAVSGDATRKFWCWLSRSYEYYLLQQLDMAVLVNTETNAFFIEKIWFQDNTYTGINHLKGEINSSRVNVTYYKPPDKTDKEFSSPKRRGKAFPKKPLRNPLQIEPDGKRYSIKHRHVEYMDWKFHFRMSSAYGPQLYDIKFKDTRIAYELGLQELSVFYSANNPAQMFADFFDSSDLIGPKATFLVPGVDCPRHATFINATHLLEHTAEPETFDHVFCLFEWNTGDPLRRHLSNFLYSKSFYEGLESVALVLRTCLTIMNYDYIIDFRFFMNGVVQTRVLFTGFISSTFYSVNENKYSYRLQKHLSGSLHSHLINFKVDLDVNGRANRFKTLNIEPHEVNNLWSKLPNAKYHQTKFTPSLKTTEKQAAYKFNFDNPKYLLFYNENHTNYDSHKCYQVHLSGMAKQLLTEGEGNEPAASWARYQMAVTKRKEEEPYSSSQYAAFDTKSPVIRFQNFLEDDESIVDEDLVAWVTLGMHHIPKSEDLPVTTTPGKDVSFSLLPFNYFPEDPAMASSNAVRIDPVARSDPTKGLQIETYGMPDGNMACSASEYNKFWRYVEKNPDLLFDTENI